MFIILIDTNVYGMFQNTLIFRDEVGRREEESNAESGL